MVWCVALLPFARTGIHDMVRLRLSKNHVTYYHASQYITHITLHYLLQQVLGQFNLGFILAAHGRDVFIVDQVGELHSSLVKGVIDGRPSCGT